MKVRVITPKVLCHFTFDLINFNESVHINKYRHVFICDTESDEVVAVDPICICEEEKFGSLGPFRGHYFCWRCGIHYFEVSNILVDIRDIPFIRESKKVLRRMRQ